MKNFTQEQPRSFDPVAAALTTVGIERDHSLYPLTVRGRCYDSPASLAGER